MRFDLIAQNPVTGALVDHGYPMRRQQEATRMNPPQPPTFGRLAENGARPAFGEECFHDLLSVPGGARVERILSCGASTPSGIWYEQDGDEFVLVVFGAAVLAFPDGTEHRLEAGDYAILPAFCRHRVAWTDSARETLWLAIHMPPRAPNLAVPT